MPTSGFICFRFKVIKDARILELSGSTVVPDTSKRVDELAYDRASEIAREHGGLLIGPLHFGPLCVNIDRFLLEYARKKYGPKSLN